MDGSIYVFILFLSEPPIICLGWYQIRVALDRLILRFIANVNLSHAAKQSNTFSSTFFLGINMYNNSYYSSYIVFFVIFLFNILFFVIFLNNLFIIVTYSFLINILCHYLENKSDFYRQYLYGYFYQ